MLLLVAKTRSHWAKADDLKYLLDKNVYAVAYEKKKRCEAIFVIYACFVRLAY